MLAFTTFGILVADWNQPLVKGFVDRVQDTYAAAESSDGFIDRARRVDARSSSTDWGRFDYPRYIREDQYPRVAATLSLWEDIESVFAYAYSGLHGEGLMHSKEWFLNVDWPTYAAWWVEDDHTPNWEEVRLRLETLHENGPTPMAFNFKRPCGPDGSPITVDHLRVREKMEKNASR